MKNMNPAGCKAIALFAVTRMSRPSSVYLAPGLDGLTWDWSDGLLKVHVRGVGIMDSVVIESRGE